MRKNKDFVKVQLEQGDAGDGEHLVLFAHVSNALKLVIVSERLGLIRFA